MSITNMKTDAYIHCIDSDVAPTESYISLREDLGLKRAKAESKGTGAVWTPMYVARTLVNWAVRSPNDVVLDPGSGRGIFLYETFRRLIGLGATPSHARALLYGVEQDSNSFAKLTRELESITGGKVPNVQCANLFDCEFPNLDAVVGNPPYVRRWWLADLDLMRNRLQFETKELKLTRLTDLACYFVVYATRFLKPGGRLALVVSDGWLDADYGTPFKRFLLQQFSLKRVIAFQHRVFSDVLVRPVLLLGEKKNPSKLSIRSSPTIFVLTSRSIGRTLRSAERLVRCADRSLVVQGNDLSPEKSWSQYINAPKVYFELTERNDFRAVGESFETRIGLQTFGKSFFVVPRSVATDLKLEPEFLHPLILSPRELDGPVVRETAVPNCFLVWCDLPISSLRGTQLSSYIDFWEKATVTARGRKGDYTGIQNLPRLKRAGRTPWYNLKTEVKRRGTFPLLVPRRFFNSYMAAWNYARFIAAENFLELAPRREVDLEAALALLNSSFAELIFRVNAHLYGGGVYNLNPGDVKALRLPDIETVQGNNARILRRSFQLYAEHGPGRRAALDEVVGTVFGLSAEVIREVQNGVAELKALSHRVKDSTGPLFSHK